MKNKFQTAVLVAFIIFALVGVLALSLREMSPNDGPEGPPPTVLIWGTIPSSQFNGFLKSLDDNFLSKVNYTEIRREELHQRLLRAIADGVGPDLLFFPHDMSYELRNRIAPLAFETYSPSFFENNFIPATEIFIDNYREEIEALPFSLDPLVLYYNRQILSQARRTVPPATWLDLSELNSALTKREGNQLLQSLIAMGEFENVRNAKEIIATLIMQAGNPITERTMPRGDLKGLKVVINQSAPQTTQPALSALSFYVEKANPGSSAYSWNISLPESREAFTSGDLAFYVGFASEFPIIAKENPNLDFRVGLLPQVVDTERETTFAKITGLTMLKNSRRPNDASRVMYRLTERPAVELFASMSGLVPVRHDVLAERSIRPEQAVFYESAYISQAWIDPNYDETRRIFKEAVEGIVSGRLSVSQAVSRIKQEMDLLID